MVLVTPNSHGLPIAHGLGIPNHFWIQVAVSFPTAVVTQISELDSSPTPGVFYIHFYNHAHRLRLEKLLCLELSRSSNGFVLVRLDPGGRFASETAARRFQK